MIKLKVEEYYKEVVHYDLVHKVWRDLKEKKYKNFKEYFDKEFSNYKITRKVEIANTIIDQITQQNFYLLPSVKARNFKALNEDKLYDTCGGVEFNVNSKLYDTKIKILLTVYDDYTIILIQDKKVVQKIHQVYWDNLIEILIDLKQYF